MWFLSFLYKFLLFYTFNMLIYFLSRFHVVLVSKYTYVNILSSSYIEYYRTHQIFVFSTFFLYHLFIFLSLFLFTGTVFYFVTDYAHHRNSLCSNVFGNRFKWILRVLLFIFIAFACNHTIKYFLPIHFTPIKKEMKTHWFLFLSLYLFLFFLFFFMHTQYSRKWKNQVDTKCWTSEFVSSRFCPSGFWNGINILLF